MKETIWKEKYKYGDEKVPEDTYKRVADFIYPPMYKYMCENKFLPGGRILAGAGISETVTLANCFVLPIKEDSVESIFECAKEAATTYKTGGGVGINLSTLRPNGAKVNNSARTSTGAVSFMQLFDTTTKVIGGKGRRGALMLSLHISHPDIEEFIRIKDDENKTSITNANISVMINDEFMIAVDEELDWDLWYPELLVDEPSEYEELENIALCYDSSIDYWKIQGEYYRKKVYKTVNAVDLWNEIILRAWSSAEPGILFWSTITEDNSTDKMLLTTNPCGEQPLPAYGACVLGSINLAEFVDNKFEKPKFKYVEFANVIKEAVIFLDNCIDVMNVPLEEQRDLLQDYRRIGLGVTGLAHCLAYMKIPYDSYAAIDFVRDIGQVLEVESYKSSFELAKTKGAYPCFTGIKGHLAKVVNSGILDEEEVEKFGIRNSTLLTIAPSGTISLMMDTSYGVEPIYELSFTRHSDSLSQDSFEIVDKAYKEYGKKDKPDFFKTAYQINPIQKVKLQATLQSFIDSSISVTTNLPKDATVEDVSEIYKLAWSEGCKGHTVYREGSRSAVLETNSSNLLRDHHQILEGKTIVIPRKAGKIYLTCNVHPVTEKPIEVFLSSAKSGSDTKAILEAYGRLISLILQNGGEIDGVIKTLFDIKGEQTDFTKGWTTHSLPDAIAKGLLKLSDEEIELKCSNCGEKILMTNGCSICPFCGYSACS